MAVNANYGGKTYSFPDGTTDSQIYDYLNRNIKPASSEETNSYLMPQAQPQTGPKDQGYGFGEGGISGAAQTGLEMGAASQGHNIAAATEAEQGSPWGLFSSPFANPDTTRYKAQLASNIAKQESSQAQQGMQQLGTAGKIVAGATEYIPALAAGAVNPVLGAAVAGEQTQGDILGQQYDETGRYNLGRAAVGGGIAAGADLATGGLAGGLAPAGSGLVRRGVAQGVEAAGTGAAMQMGTNYGTGQALFQNVPEAAGLGVVGAGLMHAPSMALKGMSRLRGIGVNKRGEQAIADVKQVENLQGAPVSESLSENTAEYHNNMGDLFQRAQNGEVTGHDFQDAAAMTTEAGGDAALTDAYVAAADAGVPLTKAALDFNYGDDIRNQQGVKHAAEELGSSREEATQTLRSNMQTGPSYGNKGTAGTEKGLTWQTHAAAVQEKGKQHLQNLLGAFDTNSTYIDSQIQKAKMEGVPRETMNKYQELKKSLAELYKIGDNYASANKRDFSQALEYESGRAMELAHDLGESGNLVNTRGDKGQFNPAHDVRVVDMTERMMRSEYPSFHAGSPRATVETFKGAGPKGVSAGEFAAGMMLTPLAPVAKRVAKTAYAQIKAKKGQKAMAQGMEEFGQTAQQLAALRRPKFDQGLESGDAHSASIAAAEDLQKSGISVPEAAAPVETAPEVATPPATEVNPAPQPTPAPTMEEALQMAQELNVPKGRRSQEMVSKPKAPTLEEAQQMAAELNKPAPRKSQELVGKQREEPVAPVEEAPAPTPAPEATPEAPEQAPEPSKAPAQDLVAAERKRQQSRIKEAETNVKEARNPTNVRELAKRRSETNMYERMQDRFKKGHSEADIHEAVQDLGGIEGLTDKYGVDQESRIAEQVSAKLSENKRNRIAQDRQKAQAEAKAKEEAGKKIGNEVSEEVKQERYAKATDTFRKQQKAAGASDEHIEGAIEEATSGGVFDSTTARNALRRRIREERSTSSRVRSERSVEPVTESERDAVGKFERVQRAKGVDEDLIQDAVNEGLQTGTFEEDVAKAHLTTQLKANKEAGKPVPMSMEESHTQMTDFLKESNISEAKHPDVWKMVNNATRVIEGRENKALSVQQTRALMQRVHNMLDSKAKAAALKAEKEGKAADAAAKSHAKQEAKDAVKARADKAIAEAKELKDALKEANSQIESFKQAATKKVAEGERVRKLDEVLARISEMEAKLDSKQEVKDSIDTAEKVIAKKLEGKSEDEIDAALEHFAKNAEGDQDIATTIAAAKVAAKKAPESDYKDYFGHLSATLQKAEEMKAEFPENPEMWLAREDFDKLKNLRFAKEEDSYAGSLGVNLINKVFGRHKDVVGNVTNLKNEDQIKAFVEKERSGKGAKERKAKATKQTFAKFKTQAKEARKGRLFVG